MKTAHPVARKTKPPLVLTAWLAGSQRPAREGVYRRAAPAGPYACWDGRTWFEDAPSVEGAAMKTRPSAAQDLPWRGLTMPPESACFLCRGHTVIDRGYNAETGRDLIDECPEC